MKVISLAVALLIGASAAGSDEATWIGRISDSACGRHHEETAEGAGALADRDCTLACVRGGSRYVLVTESGVLPIVNQQFAGLSDHAGRNVTVTGTIDNGAVTVTKIDSRN
jgi:hypothetical protein